MKVKLSGKTLYIQSALLLTAFVAIPVPAYQAIINNNSAPSVTSPQNLFSFGLSNSELNALNEFNFNHELTFSDLYLPSINNSTQFNITYNLFPPYNQMQQFYWGIVRSEFVNIEGNSINFNLQNISDNANLFRDEILPYYSYICIRTNDTFFVNLINSLNKEFILEKNINNSVYIYKNIDLNASLQAQFIKLNQTVNWNPYL